MINIILTKELKMEKLFRSKENIISFGEVWTPMKIVDEMIDLIPAHAWTDREYIFMEPTCGHGNFLVAIIKKRLTSGISLKECFETLIGMDISQENINESHVRLREIIFSVLGENSSPLFQEINAIMVKNVFLVDDSLKVIRDYGNGIGPLKELI